MYHRPYTRPGEYSKENKTDERAAWDVAHSLQSKIENLLRETNSRDVVLPKHALDMVLLHMHRELDDIKLLLWNKDDIPTEAT